MMTFFVSMAADVLVAVLLVATIVSSVKLSRRISKLKADEAALRSTIGDLVVASATAERAIAGLRATLDECDRTLTERLAGAERTSTDLVAHVQAGESVISRIAAIVGQARTATAAAPPRHGRGCSGRRQRRARRCGARGRPGPVRARPRPSPGQSRMTLPARRLARLASLPARPFRLRLIDAVTLAAIGLLVLKLTALLADEPAPPGAALPEFARVLAKARSNYEPTDPTTTGSVSAPPKPAEPAPPPVYQPVVPEPVSESERAILEKLATRRESLKQRRDELDLREQMLKDAERKLEAGVADLKGAEDKAGSEGMKRAEAEKAGMKGIVLMYETMKPRDAARVFDRLNLETLVPIVMAMNPRKMAEVLALMGSEPAEKLTVALANRARGVDAPQVAAAAPGLPPGELPAIDPGPAARPGR